VLTLDREKSLLIIKSHESHVSRSGDTSSDLPTKIAPLYFRLRYDSSYVSSIHTINSAATPPGSLYQIIYTRRYIHLRSPEHFMEIFAASS